MDGFSIKPLDASTWEAFSRLAEKNGGVWGGCWCMGFHGEGFGPDRSAERNRRNKEGRVRAGTAHAALVFEDGAAIGWCQYGSPEELPRIKLKKEVAAASPALPDWRITCFFVDKEHRGRGVSGAALAGALALIAAAGGGVVESYPEDVSGRRTSASFLYNSSLRIFEEHGFERVARLGKNHWLVRKSVGAAGGPAS